MSEVMYWFHVSFGLAMGVSVAILVLVGVAALFDTVVTFVIRFILRKSPGNERDS